MKEISTTTYVIKLKNTKSVIARDCYVSECVLALNDYETARSIYDAKKYNSFGHAEMIAKHIIDSDPYESLEYEIIDMNEAIEEDVQDEIGYKQLMKVCEKIESSAVYSKELLVIKEALSRQYNGIKPFAENKQDYICPVCRAGINFDALNGFIEDAPKHCLNCGQRFDWSGVKNNEPV